MNGPRDVWDLITILIAGTSAGLLATLLAHVLWNRRVTGLKSGSFVLTVLTERRAAKSRRIQASPQVAMLQSNDFELVERALTALRDIGDESCVPALIDALQNPRPSVRRLAADAIGDVHPNYVETKALLAIWDDASREELGIDVSPSPEGAQDMTYATGRLTAIPALALLALDDPVPEVRIASVRALGKLQHMAAMRTLMHAQRDNDATVRQSASESIGSIAQEAIRFVRGTRYKMSISSSKKARQLDDLLKKYVVPALKRAAEDGDEATQRTATEALARIAETDTSSVVDAVAPTENQPVHFSAHYPEAAPANVPFRLLVYAYGHDHASVVMSDATAGSPPGRQLEKHARGASQLCVGTPITVAVESSGLRTISANDRQKWNGSWLRFEFDCIVDDRVRDDTVFVRIAFRAGAVEIAHIKVAIDKAVDAGEAPNALAEAKATSKQSAIYTKIFVSYSRNDREAVELYRFAQEAIGNHVFVDRYSLKAGENWRAGLAKAIDDADIMQLLWSESSAASENVRHEWQYALKHKCPTSRCEGFIRPIYWTDPLPAPPPELGHLHFRYIALPGRAEPGAQALAQ